MIRPCLLLVALLSMACSRKGEAEFKGLRGARFADAMMYRYFVPPSASAEHPLPLVVYLHSNGRQGDDNEKQVDFRVTHWVENQAAHPCFVLAPQLPEGMWVNAYYANGNYTFNEADITKHMTNVLALIAELMGKYPIDKERVYIVGTSLGGFGTWDMLMRAPGLIAAAVPIEGGGDPAQVKRFVQVPVWAFHGAKDTSVPVTATRQMIAALREAGGTPRYTEYPDIDHDSGSRAFLTSSGLDEWLFAQKK